MFPRPSKTTSSSMPQLAQLASLLKTKYLNLDVTVALDDTQVKVTLLNGRHGVHEPVDKENERPIAFLKSFGATESREKAQYDYWSNTVMAFDKSQLANVTAGLEKMPDPSHEDDLGQVRAMARC